MRFKKLEAAKVASGFWLSQSPWHFDPADRKCAVKGDAQYSAQNVFPLQGMGGGGNLSIAPIGIAGRMIMAIVTSQAGQVSREVKMADKQWHRQKSFSGDHSKNLKQNNERRPYTK